MTHDESSNPLVPADDAVESSTSDDETLSDIASEQDEQAQKFAAEFLKKVIRLRGVQIDRDDYLRQELRKLGADDDTIALAQETTPVQAGLTLARHDGLATATIAFETRKSAAISFAAGLPGGFAMLATIPVDVTQYYVHAFRVMQKLAYIYGWKDFLGDLDEIDDETLGKMSLFPGGHDGGRRGGIILDDLRQAGRSPGTPEADRQAGPDQDRLVRAYEADAQAHRHQDLQGLLRQRCHQDGARDRRRPFPVA